MQVDVYNLSLELYNKLVGLLYDSVEVFVSFDNAIVVDDDVSIWSVETYLTYYYY